MTLSKKILALCLSLMILLMNAVQIIAASWISPDKDIRSPLEVEEIDVKITGVTKKISNVCYDLQSENPTSLYKLSADGTTHEAMCVAAKRTAPGNGGQAYKLDLSGLSSFKGSSSHLNEASANLTASDEVYTVWANAFKYSDLYKYNDEQILRKIAWLIEDGKWTYYPLSKKYVASDVYSGIALDFDSPVNSSNIYRDLTISRDALSRYVAFDIDSDRFGANISGLYGAAHAIASRMISGDRYHLSGTIYYSFTRTASDKATYTYGSHSAFAYGDDGKGNDNNLYRRIQLTQYFNIIAHAPEYEGDLYIYSPDKRSGVGQQWLLYVDHATDIRLKKAYANPQITKKTASGDVMLGASFDLYSDASMENKIGTLEDKNNDGIYSDFTNLEKGDDQVADLLNLELTDDVFIKSFYVHETKAPASVKNAAGSVFPLAETIKDDSIYKVDLCYSPSSGILTSDISSEGKKVYSGKIANYDVTGKGSNIVIANTQSGAFVDGTSLAVNKTTQNGYDVTKTSFTLYGEEGRSSEPLAYYRFEGDWSWFDKETGGNKLGKYYPLKLNGIYTLCESYESDCYKDTDVRYQVINTSEWVRTGDNGYSRDICTSGIAIGDVLTVDVNNDRVTCKVRIQKTADDGVIKGREFEVYYLGNDTEPSSDEVHMTTVKTDSDGTVTVDALPLGWYRIREKDHEGYLLEWQGISRIAEGDAIIRITEADKTFEVEASNKVMVNIAVIKKDAWTGELLSGASFKLYQDSDKDGDLTGDELERSWEAVTDNNGTALFKDVGIGEYYIIEDGAPAGYYASQQAYPVSVWGFPDQTVVVDGKEVKAYVVEVSDEPYKAPVYIYKRDKDNHDVLLKGAKFLLFSDTNNNGKYDAEVDQTAKVVEDGKSYDVEIREQNGRYESVYDLGGEYKTAMLRFGTYFVVERVAPEMYRGLDEAIVVTVKKPSSEAPETPDPVVLNVDNELGFGTVLTGIDDTKIPELSENAKLTDNVSYTNLIAGKEYRISGELVVLEDDGSVIPTGVTAETTFVPEGDSRCDGTCSVEFVIDTTDYKGKTVVAFERLYDKDRLIAKHEDPGDVDQTVTVPDIGTELVDGMTDTHVAQFSADTVLVDKVAYKNLIPGKEYYLTGTLYDKESGEELADSEGNIITSSASFVPENSDGISEIEFIVDTTSLQQKMIVAFETLMYENRVIAIHADIDDESQTVGVADIYTTATDEQGDKNIDAGRNVDIIDHVQYENLTPGKEYVVRGILMYSGTGEVYHDPDDHAVTSFVRFTPETSNGIVDVNFSFDGSNLNEGQRLVVYEDAYIIPDDPDKKEVLICVHQDPNNENQTVRFVADVPQTGDVRNDGEYVLGMIASVGMIISVIGIFRMLNRRLFEYE